MRPAKGGPIGSTGRQTWAYWFDTARQARAYRYGASVPIELLLIKLVKAVAELAALFMLGQGALYVLAGKRRDDNLMYQIFQVLTRPVYRFARIVTPRAVMDRHIPFAAFMLVFWLWVLTVYLLVRYCAGSELSYCRG